MGRKYVRFLYGTVKNEKGTCASTWRFDRLGDDAQCLFFVGVRALWSFIDQLHHISGYGGTCTSS